MKNKVFKIIRKLGGAKFLRSLKGDKITVLCIHRISDDYDFFFDPIKPKEFELLVEYCIKHYSIVSFSQINTKTEKPKLFLFRRWVGVEMFFKFTILNTNLRT